MNDDELLHRMQAADPARGASMPDLAASMMITPSQPPRRRRRLAAVSAATVVVSAVGIGTYALYGNESATSGDQTSVTLVLGPTTTSMASCIPFSVDVLQEMPLAFSGTATKAADNGETVTLTVDRWYRGGGADVVVLHHVDPKAVSLDALEFSVGDRYLITATGGTVNSCGYSGPWSAPMAASFDEAFDQ